MTRSQRVAFAPYDAPTAIAAEVAALGASRVMLIASERESVLTEPIAARLPIVHHQREVVMHVPVALAERARVAALDAGADVIVTIGGGSTTGLGKAVALDPRFGANGIPVVAVPTTFAGSEATDVWGLTEEGVKSTGSDPRVLPRSIVYDASLLTTLPREMVVASGLNALAHCIDAMWGPRVDPIDQALAQEGIRGLTDGLRRAADNAGIDALEQLLYGAYLAAISFASAGSGMHHKICHVLGGMFNLPHAQTHAVVLPYVLAFNTPNAPEAERRISAAFGSPTVSAGLASLRKKLDAPAALKELGMPQDGVDQAVDPILDAIPANNPTRVTNQNVAALLRAAWNGDDPTDLGHVPN